MAQPTRDKSPLSQEPPDCGPHSAPDVTPQPTASTKQTPDRFDLGIGYASHPTWVYRDGRLTMV